MIEFDCETTGLQPWSGAQFAYLYIFLSADGETAEAIPYAPTDEEFENLGYLIADNAKIQEDIVEAGIDTTGINTEIELPDRLDCERRIQEWFDACKADDEGVRAWNAKFDRAFADAAGFDIPGDGKWHDEMLVAHAINENRSVALKSIASGLFGEEAADPQKAVKKYLTDLRKERAKAAKEAEKEIVEPNYSDVPASIMEPYALEDVILTRKVSDQYDLVLANTPALERVVEFERKTMDALYGIERRGLPARAVEYRKLEQEVVENLEKLEETVQAIAQKGDAVKYAKFLAGKNWGKGKAFVEQDETGKVTSYQGGAAKLSDFNPASSQQIHAALVALDADLKFMSEKDGKLPMDADNLRAVDHPLAAAILEFRAEQKVLSTYVRPMIGKSYVTAMRHWKEPFIAPDNRIHANYRQIGARTGRMSCSDPNMQNQPRDDLRLRYNIVADEGYKLVACDLSNIEMVLFAAYCGEGRLLRAVQNGDDLHTLTANMLGFRDRARSGGNFESARQQGKTYNFSRIYGGGLRTIKRQRRCTMDEARLLKRRYDDAYPEVARLTQRIEYRLMDQGYIADNLISGRRFRVDVRDAYKATNYLVQGTAASLLKYAIVKLHEDGVPMVALVHDEIVAHVPEEEAEETMALIIKRMTEFEGLKGKVPLSADGDIVDRWSQAKKPDFVPKWAQKDEEDEDE